jgi:transposase
MWCVAKLDKPYIQRMEDVLAIYEKPFSKEEPVVCIDEKPVVLRQDTRAPMPARTGRVARRDYEYKRCGTANVFCGVEPKAGRHFLKPTPTRSAAEFADYLVEIVAAYPDAKTIHLVLDNLNTHGRKSLVSRYGEKLGSLLWDRFTVHFTPKHGSWLNQAEIEVSLLSRLCLGQRRIPDLTTLRNEVRACGLRLNRARTTIEWNFTRKQARRKLHYSFTKTRY